MNIKNKTILVTGAGSGIGRELVLRLLEKGAKIVALDIREASLQELKKSVGKKADRLSTHVVDISDKRAVESLPKDIALEHGSVDAIVNNAGIIQPFVRVNDLDYEAIEKVMNINFFGTLYMVKTFLPLLLARPEAYIVNVSSMGGFLPVSGQSVYGASKAAVKLLTEGLFAELKGTNVHVSVVFPGATATNITENSGLKESKLQASDSKNQSFVMLPASEAARLIIEGIEKNKPQIYLGKDSKLMSILYRLSPVFATNLIAKQMKSLLPK
ncbi:MAG: SDR family NAD(P)-dependent oxidoreductase [Candidatus Berkelbacteria bacterium]|nr:SDR family NAD(P)-dependent oxidoreductase [Candidatus Berkelbacteria bacterium]